MPDETFPDGTPAMAAIEALFNEDPLFGGGKPVAEPAATPPPATPAAPAPAAVASPATPAPVVAQPPAAPAPAAPATPPATPPAESEETKHNRVLVTQNQELVKQSQELVKQTTALMQELLQKNKPELTQAQRDEQIQKALERLNNDPLTFMQEVAAEAAQKEAAKLSATLRNPQQEGGAIARDIHARLLSAPDGTIIRPEIADPAFYGQMISVENQKAVIEKFFRGQPNEVLVRDPQFHLALYYEAKNAAAAKASAAPPTPGQPALDAQRAVIAGSSPELGPGHVPGPDPKADPVKAFQQSLLDLDGGFNSAASKATWKGRAG